MLLFHDYQPNTCFLFLLSNFNLNKVFRWTQWSEFYFWDPESHLFRVSHWQGERPLLHPRCHFPSVHPRRSLLGRSLVSCLGGSAPFTRILIHLQPSETSSCLEFGRPDLWMIPSCSGSSKGSLLSLLSLFKQALQGGNWGISEKKHPASLLIMNLGPITGFRSLILYWSVNFLPTGLLD